MSPAADSVRAYIDEPNASESVPRGLVRVRGWVFDETGPLDGALLLVDDGPSVRVRLGVWREDVLEAYPSVPHAGASGFEETIDIGSSGRDVVRIALLVRAPGGEWREAAAVEVRPSPARTREAARPRAAFTIVHNEQMMLPLWLRYYRRYFEPADLYVLDHSSTDGSTAGLEQSCRVVSVHHDAWFDHHWLRSTVQAFQRFLLSSYDNVLFTEVDEFVVADPRRYAGLDAYIEALAPRPAARCVGFNVVHQADEPSLRLDDALLSQRRWWRAALPYNKRLLARVPLSWSDGFHEEYNAPDDPPDPDLMLVHLHRIDHDACLARHRAAFRRGWNESDVRRGAGAHNLISDAAEFESWFHGAAEGDGPAELIPEHVRAVF